MRWINHFLLFAAAASVVAASMGAIMDLPSADGGVHGNSSVAKPTMAPTPLPDKTSSLEVGTLTELAKKDLDDDWTRPWEELLKLFRERKDKLPDIEIPTGDKFINLMTDPQNPVGLTEWIVKELAVQTAKVLDSHDESIRTVLAGIDSRILTDEALKGKVKTLKESIPAVVPSPEIDKNFNLAGFDFVLIDPRPASPPFWITKQEEAAGGYEQDHGSGEIRRIRDTTSLPESWDLRRPAAKEWISARDRADELKLENFKGGLGEVLDDGDIIGAADGFPKSAALGALTRSKRVAATRIMIQAARRSLDPRNPGVIPAEYAPPETNFATRIVIVPPTE